MRYSRVLSELPVACALQGSRNIAAKALSVARKSSHVGEDVGGRVGDRFTHVKEVAIHTKSRWCNDAEDTARSRLRSAARGDLQVPRSKTNFGSRAFAVAGLMF